MKIFILGFLAVLMVSCGFQLRGTMDYGVNTVYVQSEGADILANQVKQYLTSQSKVSIASSAQQAEAIILLSEQKLDRRVLTISAISGRLEEVELNFQVKVAIHRPDDTVLLAPQKLIYVRDYSFNERAVLAMGAEEEMLRKELLQEATLQVLRMLQAVNSTKQVGQ